jgi:hypothetical protein
MKTSYQPGISIKAVRPVTIGLTNLGYDVADALVQLSISEKSLNYDEEFLPHDTMMRFWYNVAESTLDPDIGIHAAEAVKLDIFDIHAFAFLSSQHYLAGLQRASRYQRSIHDATNLDIHEETGGVFIRNYLPGGFQVPKYPAQYLLTLWVRFGEAMLGPGQALNGRFLRASINQRRRFRAGSLCRPTERDSDAQGAVSSSTARRAGSAAPQRP